MKPLFPAAFAIAATLAASGCKSAEDYQRNHSATAAWLQSHTGRPGMNVTGDWDSPDWGEGHFRQVGSKVTGVLDDRPVGGVINGERLFLAITEGGWTSYTAILRRQYDGSLAGTYCETVPFDSQDEEQMELRRARP